MTEERTPAVGATEPTEIDPLGPDVRWANQTPMIAYLVVAGLMLTLATWKNLTWAYIIGLVLTVIWVAGFVVVKDRRERWFRW